LSDLLLRDVLERENEGKGVDDFWFSFDICTVG
jgi:hypothetical protein